MNKKQLGVIGVATVLAVLIVGLNITGITGNVTKSKIFLDDSAGQIEFKGVIYTISNVQISRTEWVTFTISSDQSSLTKNIEGGQNSKHYLNPEIGSAIVHIANVVYPPTNPKKSNVRIFLTLE